MNLPADHPLSYFEFRDQLAADMRMGLCGQSPESIMARARACSGLDPALAAEWTERFWRDLQRGLAPRRHGGR